MGQKINRNRLYHTSSRMIPSAEEGISELLPDVHEWIPASNPVLDSIVVSPKVLNLPPDEVYQDYIVLDPLFLYPNQITTFPLYLYDGELKQFVVLIESGVSLQREQLDELRDNERRPVFISKAHVSQLTEFLSEDLSQIVEDGELAVGEKTRRFSTLATSVMRSLFESPPQGDAFGAITKNVSYALTQLICSEPSSIVQLNGLRSYDYYTYSHSLNVCVLGIGLFQQIESTLARNRMQDLTRGLLLHDIGKCDIPRELTTKPGALSEEEWRIMRTHPLRGYLRLENDRGLSADSHRVALFHHEAMDGSGYPRGLARNSIPFTSRLCKIVDIYDALTSNRSYKTRLSPFDSIRLMIGTMRKQIDMDILRKFINFLYEMGKITLSQLKSEENCL